MKDSRFRGGLLLSFSNNLPKHEVQYEIEKSFKVKFISSLKKGKRLFIKDITCGINGNDFVEDKFSIVIRFNSFKCPIIVSRMLLNKYDKL
ncbi:MAG TPA: hypothetical protein VIJ57_08550 [Hanamia sp.]